ncbi:acetyl-CoA synthetase-like protein [Glonium stellatum]|uniref:Acetyl-CoA synthetase-like protein n=1 Tax=Glonium stellatum TaxID=574774 RepID=A0A8E2JX53_9PEZI|nr:acetyl-CoA synthetase-like protein [Glonium stellatum]
MAIGWKTQAGEFWERAFADVQAPQFPTVPPTHIPAPRATSEHDIRGIRWPSKITQSALLQAACSLLVSQYTNSCDVVFGATLTEIEKATIPVRVQLDWTSSLQKLVDGIQKYMIDASSHDVRLSHSALRRICRLNAGAEQASRFQLLLAVQTTGTQIKYDHGAKDHAMIIFCSINDEGLVLRLQYDPAILDSIQAQRMIFQIEHILRQLCILDHHTTKLDEIETTSTYDIEQIWSWNAAVPETVNSCVYDLIARRTEEQPDKVAVNAWDGMLTYKELGEKVTWLASWLVQCPDFTGPECVVPVCFEKSVWTTITILAIAKAGGTFIVLDPDQPRTRLITIMQDLNAKFLLCTNTTAEFAGTLAARVYVIDSTLMPATMLDSALPNGKISQHDRSNQVRPSNILYVVYTSGSTGTPKGALISHANLCSAAIYQAAALGFNKETRSFDYSSYSFDAYIFNTFYTLIAGGCLCVPSDTDRVNDIGSTIQAMKVNFVQLTPSVARLLDPKSLPDVHTLILTGEKLSKSDLEPWLGRINVTNAYGPSECTIMCAANVNIAESADAHKIGAGLGCVLWICDPVNNSRLAPIGAIGEVMIEGPIVGQGYLNDPAKTESTQICNPPWLVKGPKAGTGRKSLVFRTGDLARYNSDGSLSIVGRADTQIKLHGQRIETSEIEYYIRQILAESCECVVEVVEIISRSQQLLCFLRGGNRHDLPNMVTRIKDGLAEVLPRYMIPTVFLAIDQIPMTASGKIDRRRLKQIGAAAPHGSLIDGRVTLSDNIREPHTESELVLQQLWTDILGNHGSPIGVDESFFRRGGDSIAAMKLVAIARQRGYWLTVDTIFRKPRLSDMAVELSEQLCLSPEISVTRVPPFSLIPRNFRKDVALEAIAKFCKVEVSDIEDLYPASPLQEGMLAVTAKKANNFIMQKSMILGPSIDVERMRVAWREVLAAVPILRTRFVDVPDIGLLQVVVKAPVAWQAFESAKTNLQVQELRSLHLGGPTAQLASVALDERRSAFTLIIHHALYDAWSIDLVMQELGRAYAGHGINNLVPYSVFIKHLTGIDTKLAEKFWAETLASVEAPQFPALPSSRHQPVATMTFDHHVQDIRWPSSNITPSTLLRAACSILISQYTNSSDVVFGATTIGRQAPIAEIERVVGPTIATVPVRVQLDWNSNVDRLLRAIQMHAVEAIRFEHFGISRIRRLNPGAEQACQFQLLLVIQPPEGKKAKNGLFEQDEEDESIHAFSTHALMIVCFLQPNGVLFRFSFDTTVIATSEAQRMAQQLEHIVKQLCTIDHKANLADIPVSEGDKEQIWSWNSIVPEGVDACVHSLIESVAREQPDATAISAWDGELTYRELMQRVTELAHYLQGQGVGPEFLVPICFAKSVWAPVAMLGVILAGGVGVALDPSQPGERLKAIVSQTRSHIILSSAQTISLAHNLASNVVVVNAEFFYGMQVSATEIKSDVRGQNALFIVFTSGSTGTPKGVVITHSNFSSALKHQTEIFGMQKSTRVLDFASYTFDVAWFNVLHTLSVGACLCIPSDVDRKDNLVETIKKLNANYLFLTPSLGRHLDSASAPTLKDLIVGAEPVGRDDISGWSSDVRIRIGYGPAECTVMSNVALLQGGIPNEIDTGPGYGLNCWVVSCLQKGVLAPIGAIGELWLEGPLIGRGYLEDAEKTSVAFINDPPWLAEGSASYTGRKGLVYKSGDLAKYTSQGSVVIVGRKDAQVKIRGQRVELGEIETNARRFLPDKPQLAAEVVIPKGRKIPMLVLFIVSKRLDEACVATITQSLASLLPTYMVPSAIVPISSIPMTSTGKVNRKQLRQVGASMSIREFFASSSSGTHDAAPKREPTTAVETQLRQMWADILELPPPMIGLDDNFLQIGGDSVLAMRLAGIAHEQGLSISVASIFRHPQLANMAQAISTTAASKIDSERNNGAVNGIITNGAVNGFNEAPPPSVNREILSQLSWPEEKVLQILPATEFQQHCVECSLLRPRAEWGYFSVTLDYHVDLQRLKDACSALYQVIEIFRTVFAVVKGKTFQVVLKEVVPSITVSEVGESLDSATKTFCKRDLNEVLDLTVSFTAFNIIQSKTEDKTRLVMRMSHAHYDGISLSKIAAVIGALYDRTPTQSLSPFSLFAHFSAQSTSQNYQYWRTLLEGSSMTFLNQIQKSFPKEAISGERVKLQVTVPLPKPPIVATAATVFTASWGLTLSHFLNSRDIVFGRLVSGRNSLNGRHNDVVGPCINFAPVRMIVDEQVNLMTLLRTLQDQLINSIQHETVSLTDIVNQCTDWPWNTKFGSIAQYQNIEDEPFFSIAGGNVQFASIHDSGEADAPGPPKLLAIPVGSQCRLELSVPKNICAIGKAQELLDLVCKYFKMFEELS